MKAHPHRAVALLSLLLGTLIAGLPGEGLALNDLTPYKLYGHWVRPPGSYELGISLAVNEKWAVMGASGADEAGLGSQGGVQVFSAVTGAWVRKLVLPATVGGSALFGSAVALSGDLLVVGAQWQDGFKGAVYLYNLATGGLVRTFAIGASGGDQVGAALAIAGNRVLAGAPGFNSGRGAVYILDLATGAALSRIDLGGAGAVSDNFGHSLAAEGGQVLIGAPFTASSRGAAYLYDVETQVQLLSFTPGTAGDQAGVSVAISRGHYFIGAPSRASNKGSVFMYAKAGGGTEITASDGLGGDYFGESVAADAGMLVVGAPLKATQTGALYLFDVGSFTPALVRKILPPDALSGSYFGYTAALCANTLLTTALTDSTQASFAGAGYLFKPVLTPMSAMTKVAARGDSAPGAPDCKFYVLGDAFCSAFYTSFSALLSGAGSHGNTDTGAWTTLKFPGTVQLITRSGSLIPGSGNQVVQSVGAPFGNSYSHVPVPVVMKAGTGTPAVTATTTRWIVRQDGGPVLPVKEVSNGVSYPSIASFGSAIVAGAGETVQSDQDASDRLAMVVTFTHSAATGVTTGNDSGVLALDSGTPEGLREGADTIPAGGAFYGQFTGRLTQLYKNYSFSAATTGPVTTNQILVTKLNGGAPATVAQKGDAAPEVAGATFSALTGETTDGFNSTIFRALITGPGITVASNEGIWTRTVAGVKREAIRKGMPVGGAGLKVARVIGAWGCTHLSDQVMTLVQLAGPGVTAANDQAVVLVQEGSTGAAPNFLILMREGDPAPGCNSGRIGTLSRVVVDGWGGMYLILATLVGAPPGTDLVLYGGRLEFGLVSLGDNAALAPLRRPTILLRKGWQFDGQPGKIRTFGLPANDLTAAGMGAIGRSSCVNFTGNLAVTVEFDNNVRQIMQGTMP